VPQKRECARKSGNGGRKRVWCGVCSPSKRNQMSRLRNLVGANKPGIRYGTHRQKVQPQVEGVTKQCGEGAELVTKNKHEPCGCA